MHFSNAPASTDARLTLLENEEFLTVQYWVARMCLCTEIVFALSALYANFRAGSIISSISDENVDTIMRSSMGL